jgi:alginate O-acetyltransferase complex protein AlgI
MAVGLARMFGVRFPANFNSPYKSTNIIDFWQRWHMTLTRVFNLYLYNPIALWITRRCARQGKLISATSLMTSSEFLSRVIFPTFLTMTLIGVWHGAGLQFVVFGLIHAVYLSANHAWRLVGPKTSRKTQSSIVSSALRIGKILLTFGAVVVALVPFRATSLGSAFDLWTGMFGFNGIVPADWVKWNEALGIGGDSRVVFVLGLALAIVWGLPNAYQIFSRYAPVLTKIGGTVPDFMQWRPNIPWALLLFSLFIFTLVFLDASVGTTEFLYFQF